MTTDCIGIEMLKWDDYQGWEFADYAGKVLFIQKHVPPDTHAGCVDNLRPAYVAQLEQVRDGQRALWEEAATKWCEGTYSQLQRDQAYEQIQLNYPNGLVSVQNAWLFACQTTCPV